MFGVKQKEIDQATKKEELKSTNPLKINKRKRKQKDIIMKLIDNLSNHLKDKKDYLLKLKNSIYIYTLIACFKCRKYGYHVTKCGKREKAKKEKTKMKQDEVDIKPVTLQDLMTKVKIIKQEIKEDNSTDIDEQNIAEIVNFRDFPKPLIDSPVTVIIMTDPLIVRQIKRIHILMFQIIIKSTAIDQIL